VAYFSLRTGTLFLPCFHVLEDTFTVSLIIALFAEKYPFIPPTPISVFPLPHRIQAHPLSL